MKKLLFVNACIRGREVSRTYELCRTFLDEFMSVNDEYELCEVDLTEQKIAPLDKHTLEQRDKIAEAEGLQSPAFALSRQFADADMIVIGAPYWDLSFPAQLKAYIEAVCVNGITFNFDDSGIRGNSNAERLVYITTAGGIIGNYNLGYDYICGICDMFGIPEKHFIAAERLDFSTNDIAAEMSNAKASISSLCQKLNK